MKLSTFSSKLAGRWLILHDYHFMNWKKCTGSWLIFLKNRAGKCSIIFVHHRTRPKMFESKPVAENHIRHAYLLSMWTYLSSWNPCTINFAYLAIYWNHISPQGWFPVTNFQIRLSERLSAIAILTWGPTDRFLSFFISLYFTFLQKRIRVDMRFHRQITSLYLFAKINKICLLLRICSPTVILL